MGQDWFHILDYNNRYISLLETNDCDDLYYEMKQNIQAQNTSFLWVLTRLTPVISKGGKLPRSRIVNNTFLYYVSYINCTWLIKLWLLLSFTTRVFFWYIVLNASATKSCMYLHEYNMQYTCYVIYDDCPQICPYVQRIP